MNARTFAETLALVKRGADTAVARFWASVSKADGCWKWIGGISPQGYGMFRLAGKNLSAHRVAYELVRGSIPKELTLDHLCRNRWCVNPDHLEPVTNKENILRGTGVSSRNARVTHCPRGHPYDAVNTMICPEGFRICRECSRRRRNALSAEKVAEYNRRYKLKCKQARAKS